MCLRNEGQCKYKDDMRLVSEWSNNCSLIILVSKVKYGCVDIPLKRYLERQICNYEPFYTLVDGETTRLSLSNLKKKIIFIGYGDIDEYQRQLVIDSLSNMQLNVDIKSLTTYFCEEKELVETIATFGGVDHE